MKWSHLPVAGGIYDQNPELLDKFAYIFNERAKHEERERNKEKANSGRRSRVAGRR